MRIAFHSLLPALIAAAFGLTAPAWSAPAPTTACNVSDVQIGSAIADLCLYFPPVSNDSEGLLNSAAVNAFTGITGWDRQWKIDGSSTSDQGAAGVLQLSLANLNLAAGTVDLNWIGGPRIADVALIVKAASEMYAYFFDDLLFSPQTGTYGTSYIVQIFNDNEVRQNLSHLALYSANSATACPDTDPACGLTTTRIPAPATLALLGAGLMGLFGLAMRAGTRPVA